IRITLIDNTVVDGNRSLNVELKDPRQAGNLFLGGYYQPYQISLRAGGENIATGVGLGRASAPMTIVDNDTPAGVLGFSVTNFNVNESTKFAVVTVVRTNGSSGQVTVDYTTTDGTATS